MNQFIPSIITIFVIQVFFATLVLTSGEFKSKKDYFIWFIPILPLMVLIKKKLDELR